MLQNMPISKMIGIVKYFATYLPLLVHIITDVIRIFQLLSVLYRSGKQCNIVMQYDFPILPFSKIPCILFTLHWSGFG